MENNVSNPELLHSTPSWCNYSSWHTHTSLVFNYFLSDSVLETEDRVRRWVQQIFIVDAEVQLRNSGVKLLQSPHKLG